MNTRRLGTAGMAACSLGAAALHFAALGAHWSEYWLYGAFFAAVAWFQAIWAVWVARRPLRAVIRVGVVANAAVIAVWVLSRTVGVGVGPTPGPEALGLSDVLATLLAVLVVMVGIALLVTEAQAQWTPTSARVGLGVLVAVTVVAVTVVIGVPESEVHSDHRVHDDSRVTADAPHHGGAADGASADGATAQQQAAAARLVRDTAAAVARYADVDVARAAGFRPNPTQLGPLVHYPNFANRRDDAVLDPQRPEGLVYYRSAAGSMHLVGALYTAGPGAHPPSPGGDLTRWHSHTPGCAHPVDTPECEDRVRMYMLHVWLTDRAQNPFADTLRAAVTGRTAHEPGHPAGSSAK